MKYSILILTLLMFCITGRSQVASGQEDRAYWISVLSQVADPLLDNMSKGELRKSMPVETVSGAINPSNARTTHLEALGRLLVGIAPWLELGPDETSEGQLREKYIQLMLKSIEYGFDPESPDYLNFTVTRQPLVDAALLELTGECNMYPIEYAVMRFKEWYKGDAWYGDGVNLHMDYYNSFVIHPMLLDVLKVMQKHNKGESDFYKKELRRFSRYAEQQERMISPDGAYPVVGRSIAYRFGAFHVLSQAALDGLLPASVTKAQVRCGLTAVIKRHMAVKGNFDERGWLTLGFAGHQPQIAERYISTGSLYLCSVVFTALGLPATDEFWCTPYAEWTGKKIWNGNKSVKLDKAIKDN